MMHADTWQMIVAALRLTAWVMLSSVAIVAVHYVKVGRQIGDPWRRHVATGVALSSTGWALHQLFWWWWQLAIINHMADVKLAIERSAAVMILPYVLVLAGCVCMLSPYLVTICARWRLLGIAAVATVMAFGAVVARMG